MAPGGPSRSDFGPINWRSSAETPTTRRTSTGRLEFRRDGPTTDLAQYSGARPPRPMLARASARSPSRPSSSIRGKASATASLLKSWATPLAAEPRGNCLSAARGAVPPARLIRASMNCRRPLGRRHGLDERGRRMSIQRVSPTSSSDGPIPLGRFPPRSSASSGRSTTPVVVGRHIAGQRRPMSSVRRPPIDARTGFQVSRS